MTLKIDLHVHTTYSGDSVTTPAEALLEAKRKRLDGIAITDHDTIEAYQAIPRNSELLIIPGIEVSSREGHILGLGTRKPVEPGLPAAETVKRIHQLGGIAVVPHPMAPLKSSLNEAAVMMVKPDALETLNGSTSSFISKKGMNLALRLKLPQIGGSDSHYPSALGRAYTLIEAELSLDAVLEAVKTGRVKPAGRGASPGDILRKVGRRVKRRRMFRALPSGLGRDPY